MIRSMMGKKKLQLFTKRFFPAGNYTWVVPRGCKEVDVFLVGGVGGGSGDAGGGGYTKTFKSNNKGGKMEILFQWFLVKQFRLRWEEVEMASYQGLLMTEDFPNS